MDTRVVDAVTEQFSRVALDFPYAVRLLRYVGISHNPKFFKDVRGGQPWAATVMDGKGLLLNSRWYENDKKMRNDLRRTQSDGFHPDGSDTLGFPIAHEMGHLVYDWIKTLRRIGLQGGAKPISQLTREWIHDHAGGEELSRYSLVNHQEAWAEGFASLYLGAPLTPYAQELKKFLNRVTDMSKWVAIK